MTMIGIKYIFVDQKRKLLLKIIITELKECG